MIHKPSKQDGFTLIELLVVVVIIGILASVAVPNFMGAQDKAKNSGVQSNCHSVQMAIEQYAVDNASIYPAAIAGAATSIVAAGSSYLTAFPRTPWNTTQTANIAIPAAATDVLLNATGRINPNDGTATLAAGSNPVPTTPLHYGAVSYRMSGTASERYELLGTGKTGGNAMKVFYIKNY